MTLLPITDGGDALVRHASLESAYVAARNVDVWLPPGYASNPQQRYPVIYMHDGQNLFDPQVDTGYGAWLVGTALAALIARGSSGAAIIVGIWNTPRRRAEYMPQRPLETADPTLREAVIALCDGPPQSDAYLRFITTELKPLIDTTYRTRPTQPDTFVIGSSMGGLISLYALAEYPQIFAGAGCLSTHWPIGGNMLVDYCGAALPPPGRHRLYFDFGTAGLDADYEPFQQRMDGHLSAAGYTEGSDWITRRFAGADHNETAWRARVHLPLAFLLGVHDE